MSGGSKIEWTETTWNVISGCTRVSAGCDHCYIERTPPFRMAGRRFDKPGTGGTTGLILHNDRLVQPFGWRKPRRVFVNSLADVFHEDVPTSFIAEIFAVMAVTPQHTYQLLTKRHSRMRSLLQGGVLRETVWKYAHAMVIDGIGAQDYEAPWPLPNVWVGVSVESQQWADIRIPALLETPAAVRWLSCEPLLGPVDLLPYLSHQCDCPGPGHNRLSEYGPRPDWVVVGGESGAGARPMHPDWARSLRDQCTEAGVSYFFKQWGEWVAPSQMLADTFMSWDIANGTDACDRDQPWRMGKKRAGRELDGRTWDEYPAGAR